MIVFEIGTDGVGDVHVGLYKSAQSLEAAARWWAGDNGPDPVPEDLVELVVTDGDDARVWVRRELEEMRREEWRERCADMFNERGD